MALLERRPLHFFVAVTVVLAIFLLPWPGLASAFTGVGCAVVNPFLRAIPHSSVVAVALRPSHDGDPPSNDLPWSTTLVVHNVRETTEVAVWVFNLRVLAFFPLSVLLALAIATCPRNARAALRSLV